MKNEKKRGLKPLFTVSQHSLDLAWAFSVFVPSDSNFNAIQSLISRAYDICSSYSNFHSELNFLKQFFYSNGALIKLVEHCINKFLWSKYSVNSVNDSETSQTMYVCQITIHRSPPRQVC